MFLLAIYSYVGVPILLGMGLLVLVALSNHIQRKNTNGFDRKMNNYINKINNKIKE